MDADQGFMQKIFYVHVPMAIVALCGFVFGGDLRDPAPAHAATALRPAQSYVAIHLSLILGVGVLITGSIWAGRRGATGGCGTSRRSSRS